MNENMTVGEPSIRIDQAEDLMGILANKIIRRMRNDREKEWTLAKLQSLQELHTLFYIHLYGNAGEAPQAWSRLLDRTEHLIR